MTTGDSALKRPAWLWVRSLRSLALENSGSRPQGHSDTRRTEPRDTHLRTVGRAKPGQVKRTLPQRQGRAQSPLPLYPSYVAQSGLDNRVATTFNISPGRMSLLCPHRLVAATLRRDPAVAATLLATHRRRCLKGRHAHGAPCAYSKYSVHAIRQHLYFSPSLTLTIWGAVSPARRISKTAPYPISHKETERWSQERSCFDKRRETDTKRPRTEASR